MRPQTTQIDTSRLSPAGPGDPPWTERRSSRRLRPSRRRADDAGADAGPAKAYRRRLCSCFDPEIPVNIYELGLIYNVEMSTDRRRQDQHDPDLARLSGGGNLAGGRAAQDPGRAEGVTSAKVDVVWEPPWDKSRMSEAAKLQLGIDDWRMRSNPHPARDVGKLCGAPLLGGGSGMHNEP